jgi:tetratricopeptide (TPR) repeat protein
MDPESLEQLFVGRDPIMAEVLKKVLASVGPRKERHHVLLVGPRGSGKTHFVALAYHRILHQLKARRLDQRIVIAFLNEEEWGVASFLDLLVRILRALVTDANGMDERITAIYELFARDPEGAVTLAESILRDYVGSRTLLLVCENLVDLFHGLEVEGQRRWRAFIQQTGFWTILATSPALFAALTEHEHPFYGFFAIHELKKLDYADAHGLLVKKALHDNNTELAELLQRPVGRARIRAVHHLAAGNHRAYVVLYDFLNRESLDDLIKPFLQMVDDLTPYYQDKMRQLPPAQRKLIEFLCQSGRPAPVKDIAAGCLMTQQTAAKQLGELMTAGFVQKSPLGRQTFCELSEPLMRICIEVKDNRAEHFRLFVEFLRHWFSNRELEARVNDLDSSRDAGIHAVHLREALRCSRMENGEPFVDALEEEAARCMKERDYAGCAAIYQGLIRERSLPSDYYGLTVALNRARKLEEAISVGIEAVEKFPQDPNSHFHLAQSLFRNQRYSEALEHVDRSISLGPPTCAHHCFRSDTLSALKRYDDAIQAARASFALEPTHWHSYDQIIDALVDSDRKQEAERQVDELLSRFPNQSGPLTAAARGFRLLSKPQKALELLDQALALDPASTIARADRGYVHFELEDYTSARADLEWVLKRKPDAPGILCLLSDVLTRLGDFPGAARVAERLIRVDPEHDHAYVVLGRALFKSGAKPEGVDALRKLLPHDNFSQIRLAAKVALEAQQLDLARSLVARGVELRPRNPDIWLLQGSIQLRLGDIPSALESAREARKLGARSTSLQLEVLKAESSRRALPEVLSESLRTFERDEVLRQPESFVKGMADALSISVKHFGPLWLGSSILVLRGFAREAGEEGLVGRVLTGFLSGGLREVKAPWDVWRSALDAVKVEVQGLANCQIPLAFLEAALGFRETGDQRHLLQLPLELRQLLEEELVSVCS